MRWRTEAALNTDLDQGGPPDIGVHRRRQAAIQRAQVLADLGKYDHALREAQNALAADPESSRAHYLAGLCYVHLKDYKKAEHELKQAIRLDPDWAWPHWMMANMCVPRKKIRQGLREIDLALELDSNVPMFYATKGALFLNEGKPEKALKLTEQALSMSPEHTYSKHIRTLALVNLGRHAEADQEAVSALQKAPDNSDAWYQRGLQLYSKGQFAEARAAHLEAMRLNPENARAEEALVKAIAAKHPFFGLLCWWNVFLLKFPPRTRGLIIMGIILVTRALPVGTALLPVSEGVESPLLGLSVALRVLWLLFCLYMIISRPLFRLAVKKRWLK